jgi:hypothetical protein
LRAFAVFLIAIVLSGFTYLRLERLGRRAWPAIVARSAAWAALGLLIVNVSCPRALGVRRPIVLLDASLSMSSDSSRWQRARVLADSLGEVRFAGDDRPSGDSLPSRGQSRLAPALMAAAAQDRPVVVVTDGEIDDAAEIPPDLRRAVRVEVLPRVTADDWAIVEVSGPPRITAGDSIRLEVTLRRTGTPAEDSVLVELAAEGGRGTLARRRVTASGVGSRLVLRAASAGLPPGEHILSVRLAGVRDAEPRTDQRLHHLVVAETPGVVLVASPGDWDARFLFRALTDVSALPVRGYVRLGAEWRAMGTLLPVSADAVRRAVRGADLLVLKGTAVERAGEGRGRGIWLWPSGAGATLERSDWYLAPTPVSPLAAAFAGLPLDSFPPAVQLTSVQPPQGGWVALMAQAGRRGAPRPAMTGVEAGRRRTVTTAVDGLWRWAFRGGSSEQGYRALVASTVSWLLGSPDSVRGSALPVRRVVPNGRPIIFGWAGAGAPRTLDVTWSRGDSAQADSLRFDGAGRAQAWLPTGTWRYRLDDGAGGLVAVETYSDEFLPRPLTLAAQPGVAPPSRGRTAARDWWWLFLLAVAALCVEWGVRRRLGLR